MSGVRNHQSATPSGGSERQRVDKQSEQSISMKNQYPSGLLKGT